MLKYIEKVDNMTKLTVNPDGTEEVILNETQGVSCLPSLDIRYGEGESSVLQQNQIFRFRQTGGGDEDVATGTARIEKISGNTVVWNQIIPNGDFSNGATDWYKGNAFVGTTSVSGGVFTLSATADNSISQCIKNLNVIENHKYLFVSKVKRDNAGNCVIYVAGKYIGNNTLDAGTWTYIKKITTAEASGSKEFNFGVMKLVNGENAYYGGGFAVDLTLIYGAGNEPTSVAQFEADYQKWFGKPLTYEPYDAGSLRSVQMQGIKSVGFNQWDEEWEIGRLDTTTGLPANIENQIRAKNYIPVIGGGNYHCLYGGSGGTIWVLCYDVNKNIIVNPNISKSADKAVNATNIANITFTLPLNCRYVRFYLTVTYGTTYNNNICINISDTNKNGTYEPYKEHIVSIPVTTLKGKVNGEGESVVIFPDGMKGVNDVKDEIINDNGVWKAIKRVGRVDLGGLTWSGNNGLYHAYISNMKPSVDYALRRNGFLSAIYMPDSQPAIDVNVMTDKRALRYSNSTIYIKDTSFSDAATFKTAMSGVYLDYELNNPIIYELTNIELDIIKRYITDSNGNPTQVLKVMKGENKVYEYE